jgi:hypothetical protein
MKKCKYCKKMRAELIHWLYRGELFHGCIFCRIQMIKKIKKEKEYKENEDELI